MSGRPFLLCSEVRPNDPYQISLVYKHETHPGAVLRAGRHGEEWVIGTCARVASGSAPGPEHLKKLTSLPGTLSRTGTIQPLRLRGGDAYMAAYILARMGGVRPNRWVSRQRAQPHPKPGLRDRFQRGGSERFRTSLEVFGGTARRAPVSLETVSRSIFTGAEARLPQAMTSPRSRTSRRFWRRVRRRRWVL